MKNEKLSVFQLQHPQRAELERLWTIEGDLSRTLQALELLVGPPEFFRVSGLLASALYTQALVSYVRCFASGKRKGLDSIILEDVTELKEIHEHVKSIRDRHVAHPVGDFERCTLLVAAKDTKSKSKGLGVHHLYFSGAGPDDLKKFRKLVEFVRKRVNEKLEAVGTQIARDVISPRATWKSSQNIFWKRVNGEDVYGPGW